MKRTGLALCYVGIVVASALFATEASAAAVRFHKSASVASSVVRLGDVAEIVDSNPETAEHLRSITIAPTPAAGRSLRLDFATIRSRLQAVGINLATTEFAGSSVVLVSSSSQGAPAEEQSPRGVSDRDYERATRLVSQAVEQYISRNYPQMGNPAAAVELREEDVPLLLEAATSGYEVKGGQAPWNAPQQMAIRFLDRQEHLQEVAVQCRLTPRPYVIAVKYTMPAGQVLQESDLVWIPTSDPSTGIERPQDIIGRETTRALRKNEAVRPQDIRSIPLVRGNDIVTAYSRASGITVKRQLKARTDGLLGDTVTLVTLDGRQRIVARVIGFHEAEVIGSDGPPSDDVHDGTGSIRFLSGTVPAGN
jgi:flagella basal body P-ring formation protein FlgA